ncbi:MAG: hypothetical protein H6744_07945 [Deltaproteobacteria bacterium]|nr:hypothetical protein [Deltaproteobacteria bacterium]MCB9786612.1 hypothetical protein [Deltaproteobacteria bacterium]
MARFPPALPHGHIEEALPDVFYVRGRFPMKPGLAIGRTMTILRQGRSLTLVNAMRLDDAGEVALAELGEVQHVVRIGMAHDRDDPYVVDRYGARFWALPKMRHGFGLEPHELLSEDGALPLDDASLFVFRNARGPEAALHLPVAGGLLVTCDCAQNHADTAWASLLGKLATRVLGLHKPGQIGPPGLKFMQRPGGPPMAEDFRRLCELEFRHLISGHGPPLLETAREALRARVRETFA